MENVLLLIVILIILGAGFVLSFGTINNDSPFKPERNGESKSKETEKN